MPTSKKKKPEGFTPKMGAPGGFTCDENCTCSGSIRGKERARAVHIIQTFKMRKMPEPFSTAMRMYLSDIQNAMLMSDELHESSNRK